MDQCRAMLYIEMIMIRWGLNQLLITSYSRPCVCCKKTFRTQEKNCGLPTIFFLPLEKAPKSFLIHDFLTWWIGYRQKQKDGLKKRKLRWTNPTFSLSLLFSFARSFCIDQKMVQTHSSPSKERWRRKKLKRPPFPGKQLCVQLSEKNLCHHHLPGPF